MKEMICGNRELMIIFEEFKEESRKKSHMFAFWNEYIDMVMILLQFIKAERTGNWEFHLLPQLQCCRTFIQWIDRIIHAGFQFTFQFTYEEVRRHASYCQQRISQR